MIRACVCVVLLLSATRGLSADDRYPVTGLVLEVRAERGAFVASIDAIPGFMAAMAMPFQVHDTSELRSLVRGAMIDFTLVVSSNASWAEDIRIRDSASLEQDPLAARRLSLLREIISGRASAVVPPGAVVPDFHLLDQKARPVSLSDFRGQTVAVNFTYTSCVLPDFCVRMVNHFGALQRRFASRLGRDLVFLTVSFDPARDHPDVLDRYAARWKADADTWHFLTGPLPDVRPVLASFGMAAFSNDGLMDHGLRTAIVDGEGRLVVTLEGNQFSTDQLGDLIAAELMAATAAGR